MLFSGAALCSSSSIGSCKFSEQETAAREIRRGIEIFFIPARLNRFALIEVVNILLGVAKLLTQVGVHPIECSRVFVREIVSTSLRP